MGDASLRLTLDARVELLGIVQYLAGARRASRFAPALDPTLEKAFGALRRHAAVKAFQETAKRNEGNDPYGIVVLFLTDLPELKWRHHHSLLSPNFVAMAGGRPALEDFLAKLRDFAAKARPIDFLKAERARFEAHGRLGAARMGEPDYWGEMCAYTGMRYECRHTVYWSLLYTANTPCAYIIPYPYQGGDKEIRGPFEAFTIATHDEQDERVTGVGACWWSEPLHVFIEVLLGRHEKRIDALGKKGTPGYSGDPVAWRYYVTKSVVNAMARRLNLQVKDADGGPIPAAEHHMAALCERLAEYEGDRKRWPALPDFYPRLLDVFEGR